MFRVELLIQDDLSSDIQSDALLEIGTVIDVGDESGLGIVGRIVSIRIRADRQPSLEDV